MVMDELQRDHDSDEEALLVREARHGDRQAYFKLVDRHWDRVCRWLFHLLHDMHDAEEAASETFLRAYSALPMIEPPIALSPLLFRIAYDTVRRQAFPKRTVRLRVPKELRDRAPASTEVVAAREWTKRLLRAVGRLPQPFRAAFLLVVEAGFRFDRVAEILDISEKRVRFRVAQARLRLMATLHADGVDRALAESCRQHRRELLHSENPALPDDPTARHLAICPECRRWQGLLVRIETDASALFVPESKGKARFGKLFLEAPEEPAPARVKTPRKTVAVRIATIVGCIVLLALLVFLGMRLGDWVSDLLVSAEPVPSKIE
jgi:RNA polymerase sigma factor (sigma-70 family)